MATEIPAAERKYDAPQGAALPDLAELPYDAAEADPEEQAAGRGRASAGGGRPAAAAQGAAPGRPAGQAGAGPGRPAFAGRAVTRSAAGGPPEAGRRPFGAGVVLARGGRGHGVRQSAGTHAAVLRPAGTAGRAGLGPPDAHRHPAAAQHAEILRPGAAP